MCVVVIPVQSPLINRGVADIPSVSPFVMFDRDSSFVAECDPSVRCQPFFFVAEGFGGGGMCRVGCGRESGFFIGWWVRERRRCFWSRRGRGEEVVVMVMVMGEGIEIEIA